jgi:hypothetical protein
MIRRSKLIVVLAAGGCTVTPDTDPRDDLLSAECEDCLVGDGGAQCGEEEVACLADGDCDSALTCALRADCFEVGADPDCVVERRCAPRTNAGAELFDAMEACARTTCAAPCHFGTIE